MDHTIKNLKPPSIMYGNFIKSQFLAEYIILVFKTWPNGI